jgi:hypothetical protein
MSARPWIAAFAFCLLVASALTPSPVASDPAAAGESWEVTSQMTMVGMPMQMPSQTRRVCSKQDEAPPNPDPSCRNSALARSGNKVTWTVECTGSHAMSGRGELTYANADSYKGSIRFESADGVMLLKLSGTRVGSCPAPK